jgi:broad specificity phosphatase PhoE
MSKKFNLMKKIYLIRHAAAKMGSTHHDFNFHLTDLGIQQAHARGRFFLEAKIKPAMIFCSELTRARETAKIINSYVHSTINYRQDLIEHGSEILLAENPLDQLVQEFPEKIHSDGSLIQTEGVIPGQLDWTFAVGGETLKELYGRAEKSWRDITDQCFSHLTDDTFFIVSHGSFISAMLSTIFKIPVQPVWSFNSANTGYFLIYVYQDESQAIYPCLANISEEIPYSETVAERSVEKILTM